MDVNSIYKYYYNNDYYDNEYYQSTTTTTIALRLHLSYVHNNRPNYIALHTYIGTNSDLGHRHLGSYISGPESVKGFCFVSFRVFSSSQNKEVKYRNIMIIIRLYIAFNTSMMYLGILQIYYRDVFISD